MCENDSAGSVFSTFDAERGRGREVARIARGRGGHCFWALSPDGTQLAVAFPDQGDTIRIMDLATRQAKIIPMRFAAGFNPRGSMQDFCFVQADGREGLVVGAFTHLLHVGPDGAVTPLHQADTWLGFPRVSGDGKHVAWQQLNVATNAWLLETP